MAKTWHLSTDGAVAEVLDEKIFAERCLTGKVSDATMLWTPGMDAWQSYAELRAADDAAAGAIARRAARARDDAEKVVLVTKHDCPKCGKSWPESLMAKVGKGWICRPCQARLTAEAKKQAELAALKQHSVINPKLVVALVLLCAALYLPVVWGVAWFKEYLHAPPTEPAEKWAGLPWNQWPLLVAPAEVRLYRWSQPVRIANSFLLRDARQRAVAVGASNVFQGLAVQARVVEPNAAPGKPLSPGRLRAWLAETVVGWDVGAAPPRLTFTKLRSAPVDFAASEVLLLGNEPAVEPTGLQPLHVRTLPMEKDQPVFVVGGPLPEPVEPTTSPSSPKEKQAIRRAVLHEIFNHQKTLDLEMRVPVDPVAMTGALVLDDGGHLMGVVNGTLDPSDKKGGCRSLSAESVVAFAGALELAVVQPAPSLSQAAQKK